MRILRLLAKGSGSGNLCDVAADALEMSGAGIMFLSGDLPQGSACTTNGVSAMIEDLQYTLGEGPGVDAHRGGTAVLEPDLAAPILVRWPGFAAPALAGGAKAVFGFPVRVGVARLGALNLYRDRPGPLTDDQHADALVVAEVAARALLSLQADAAPGTLAAELAAEADLHSVVHQAAGMVSVQLGVTVGEALVRLRGHAFRTDRLLADVADDVVNRRMRFSESGDG